MSSKASTLCSSYLNLVQKDKKTHWFLINNMNYWGIQQQ